MGTEESVKIANISSGTIQPAGGDEMPGVLPVSDIEKSVDGKPGQGVTEALKSTVTGKSM